MLGVQTVGWCVKTRSTLTVTLSCKFFVGVLVVLLGDFCFFVWFAGGSIWSWWFLVQDMTSYVPVKVLCLLEYQFPWLIKIPLDKSPLWSAVKNRSPLSCANSSVFDGDAYFHKLRVYVRTRFLPTVLNATRHVYILQTPIDNNLSVIPLTSSFTR